MERKVGQQVVSRLEELRQLIGNPKTALEIGPSICPVLPKSANYDVDTVDHCSAADLRSKYRDDPGIDQIDDVDYIWQGEPLHDLIGKTRHYDVIVSSHVIEHIPDLIGHLKSCEILLKPDGLVVMAVPDMRFSFDAMRHTSTTGEALAAYRTGDGRHAPAAMFDAHADAAVLGGRDSWAIGYRGPTGFRDNLQLAISLFEANIVADGKYLDTHGWCFSPSSFRLLIDDFRTLGLCNLKVQMLQERGAVEFFVTLSSGAPVEPESRILLKRHLLKEKAMAIAQLLGASEDLRARMFAELRVDDNIEILPPL